jgi:hypothetical protein
LDLGLPCRGGIGLDLRLKAINKPSGHIRTFIFRKAKCVC